MGDQAGDFFEKLGTNQRKNYPNQPPVANGRPAESPLEDALAEAVEGLKLRNKLDEIPKTERVWAKHDDVFWEGTTTTKTIPSGIYNIIALPNVGPALHFKNQSTDELIVPDDDIIPEIIIEFNKFWASKVEFDKRGLVFKRGFMLHGPPGSGKTSLLALLNQILIREYKGIILDIENPQLATEGLRLVRKIEPDRPIILLLEDIDSLVEHYGEDQYLSLLDGEDQVPNIVSIATTNYPERLDPRFVNRPSRFDKVIFLDYPNTSTRRQYLKHKEPNFTDSELDEWTNISKGFTIAHLKEMIVAVKCLGQPLNEVVERLQKMKKKPSSLNQSSIGFNND
jgi:SpoVK/Ycf46/Vps4 family AAA+-type ATPase